jgi:hypothetical protein
MPCPTPNTHTSTHHFDTENDALEFRKHHGTGGWVYVCQDKGEATLFPYHMTPTAILLTGTLSSSGGRLIGQAGNTIKQEEIEPCQLFS